MLLSGYKFKNSHCIQRTPVYCGREVPKEILLVMTFEWDFRGVVISS